MPDLFKGLFGKKSNELFIILAVGLLFTFFASYFGLFESIVLFVEEYNPRKLGGVFSLSQSISLLLLESFP